jgi:quercetin dioxygenase-like cupin family protein
MMPEKLTLAETIDYQDGAIVSKEIVNQSGGKIITFAFDAGQELSEHTAPFDAFVTALDGRAVITIEGNPFELKVGESILMPAYIPHALKADERFKMLLCMIKV